MTIDKILACSADELEKMSDAELLEYFKPCLHVTRPDLCVKPTARVVSSGKSNNFVQPTAAVKAGIARAAELGIDVSFLNEPRKIKRR